MGRRKGSLARAGLAGKRKMRQRTWQNELFTPGDIFLYQLQHRSLMTHPVTGGTMPGGLGGKSWWRLPLWGKRQLLLALMAVSLSVSIGICGCIDI